MKSFFLVFCMCTGSVAMVNGVVYGQSGETRFVSAFKKFEADTQFKHALISLYLIDSKTGKVILDRNAQVGLAPASCLKIVTSAAALDLLGRDYQYKTGFSYDGDLNIEPTGDPTFGSWRWESTKEELIREKLKKSLKENNISSYSGNIVVADCDWETQVTPKGWTWEDIGNYYGAGARGLNWHENQYDLIVKPGKAEGDPVEILRYEPDISPAVLTNELKTGRAGSGDKSIIIYRKVL